MSTIQQELVIKARADVADAKKGLASLDQSVDGLASAQEGLKSASADAAQGLAAEASAAASAAKATEAVASAANDAAAAASKLEGDAKGAGSGMDKASGEARKLTDQLKEVGDGLDVAAGKMIEGIGGPKAIKAIAGAGMALGALKEIGAAFLESSEALFKSWGEEGLKVWDITERSLFKLKGQFAGAILGTDDMYLAAGRLSAGFEALTAGVQLVIAAIQKYMEIAPTGQFIKYLFDVTGATEGYSEMVASATERIKRQVAAEKEAATSAAALAKPLGSAREQYENIRETVDRLTGKIVDKDQVERESTIKRLKDLQKLAEAEEKAAQLKAIRDNSELKRAGFIADATKQLIERGKKEAREYFNSMSDHERAFLTASKQQEIIQERIASLIETERPAMVEGALARYRRDATALMAEMASPLETGTQLYIEELQSKINEIQDYVSPSANTAGQNVGTNFAKGIGQGISNSSEPEDKVLAALAKIDKKVAEAYAAGGKQRLAALEVSWAAEDQARKAEAERQQKGVEFLFSPEEMGKARAETSQKEADAAKAAANTPEALAAAQAANLKRIADAKAEFENQIKSIQETSGAVLDLADAFATLGGVQDGVVGKMRQVVDVVIKIMQATEALSAVQAAQAATATASAAATSAAATSAATATATAGAAGASAFVPVLGAVTAAIGLIGSLFGGESSSGPQRRTKPRTVYTSAGESQGAGGDFAYFEGGRSNVTIVTNDAASIRAMQGRLSFVAARGGSGF